ncbi:hypothetical protein [Dyadobacter sp. CY323]|uniref:hypothetical protein n=1 Tax=Dyadobacter sp. CY323 TaxID=2907302 RepID=UPI001F3691B8|nr:hypothetical protein [Dyadobacter sp. CY323]MCE6990510.1 hypothetical protein [Dyadobacter sp. CY323]
MENGQVRASSLDQLDHCCRLVSEVYGKPDIGKWTNGDYVKLGYTLYKKTQVQISPNTLKRIFGKIRTDVRYYPQRATRDALARYIGYSDWENFNTSKPVFTTQVHNAVREEVSYSPVIVIDPVETSVSDEKRQRWPLALAGMIVLVVAFVFSYKLFFVNHLPEEVRLVCQNPVGGNPHSAVFVLPGLGAYTDPKDQYVIEFGDGRKIPVTMGDSLYSHYYEVPGRYHAVLKKNGYALDTASVYLQTDGWTATAEMMYDTTRVYPIEIADLLISGKKSVSALEVSHAGVDTNRTFFVKFINTHITHIDGDNFDLFIKLKTSPSRAGVRCSQVRVTVFGETSKHLFDVMKPGCVHWTDLQFSEINKQGESNQLNFLGADLHQGGSVQMKVVNKHARVFINEKQVYETDYLEPLKQIYGLGITFAGIGEIHSVLLKDLKTGKTFDGNFD